MSSLSSSMGPGRNLVLDNIRIDDRNEDDRGSIDREGGLSVDEVSNAESLLSASGKDRDDDVSGKEEESVVGDTSLMSSSPLSSLSASSSSSPRPILYRSTSTTGLPGSPLHVFPFERSPSVLSSSGSPRGSPSSPMRPTSFVPRRGERPLREKKIVQFHRERVPYWEDFVRMFRSSAPDGQPSSRQAHILSLGQSVTSWKEGFKQFTKTCLRLHFIEPAFRGRGTVALFETPASGLSPHSFSPSSRFENVTTPRFAGIASMIRRSRLDGDDSEAEADFDENTFLSSLLRSNPSELTELWSNVLHSCEDDATSFWKVCQVCIMTMAFRREKREDVDLDLRFANVFYLLGLLCSGKSDNEYL